jgi:hypothetical protein
VVSASFMFSGIGTLSDRELRRLADELAQSGLATIEPLWEPPDLSGGSWVWSDYSPAALLRRTQQVYQGALDAYAELVDQYFPAWRATLGMAALMPLRLLGTLEPTTADTDSDGPGLFGRCCRLSPGSGIESRLRSVKRDGCGLTGTHSPLGTARVMRLYGVGDLRRCPMPASSRLIR